MKRSGVGLAAALGLVCLVFASAVSAQSVAIVGGAPAVEDFDALVADGTSSTLPDGWFISESGTNANTTYAADDGSIQSGNTYSYGSAGSTERALGGLQSGSLNPTFGAQLINSTGGTLAEIAVQYTGEQWRLGLAGRPDRLDFQYSLDATSLTTGTWIHVDALDLAAPVDAGTAGPLDGNDPANRTAVAGTISGLSLAANATIWVRWTDFNASSNDDGLAIDNISFGVPGDFPPLVISTVPAEDAVDVAVDTPVSVRFSENIMIADAGGISLDCGVGTPGVSASVTGNTLNITPASDLPFGSACALDLTASSISDLDGTPDPMDAPFQLLFGTVADDAPVLLSSTPANGANDFPANANLQLVFSEAVTFGADWFAITCSVTGTRGEADVTLGGGPSSFTLNPALDFSEGESCTLVLDPSAIEDVDGTVDALVDPGSIAFVPAAPVVNQPPTVLSTTPMSGSSDFPSAADIVVLFSEAVTISPGAFTLACDSSTGISLSHALSGTSFSIDTGTALVASDACTFTVVATLVQDSEGATLAADVVIEFTVSAGGAGSYYNQVNTSSPEQLRCSLHETIKGHTVYPYSGGGTDTWAILNMADEDPVDPGKILDAYKNESYTKITGGQGAYNREHTWPNSLGFSSNTLAAYTDTHMLYLTNVQYNSDRGNKPYANCPGCTEDPTTLNHGLGGGTGVYPGNSNWYDGSSFEVWGQRKGDMARAIFYMAIRYEGIAAEDAHDGDIPDLELTDNRALIVGTSNTAATAYMGLLTTLLQWHQADPPDARELARNEIVQGFQGNRNPFIDHPEWATLDLFQSSQPADCQLNTGGNTAPVAVDDAYVASENLLLSVAAVDGVLANDTDAENDQLTAELIANAINGSVTLNADGSFTYSPTPDTCGSDSFTYRASDGQAVSAAAVVSLDVTCDADPDEIFANGFED